MQGHSRTSQEIGHHFTAQGKPRISSIWHKDTDWLRRTRSFYGQSTRIPIGNKDFPSKGPSSLSHHYNGTTIEERIYFKEPRHLHTIHNSRPQTASKGPSLWASSSLPRTSELAINWAEQVHQRNVGSKIGSPSFASLADGFPSPLHATCLWFPWRRCLRLCFNSDSRVRRATTYNPTV